MKRDLFNEDSINGLREELSVEMLFCAKTIRGPTTLIGLLQDYLVLKGFIRHQHPNNDKIMYGLAHFFLKDDKARDYPIQQLICLRSSSTAQATRAQAEPLLQLILLENKTTKGELLTTCLIVSSMEKSSPRYFVKM